MAKVSLTSITPIKGVEDKKITCNNQEIIVKQYLPITEKTTIVENMVNNVFDENFIISPIRYSAYINIEIIRAYTNINITDKMIENIAKTYDTLALNGIIIAVRQAIPPQELNELMHYVDETIGQIQMYNRSFLGIINAINADQDKTNRNVDTIFETLNNPQEVGLVKEILDKLG